MAPNPDRELVAEVMRGFDEDKRSHDLFCEKVERGYRAYRGVIERRSKASAWTSKLHPPYAHQIVETLIANVVDPSPRWPVKLRARMAAPDEVERYRDGAKANELLLAEQLEHDHFAQKQTMFAKQCYIAGLSVYKTYWSYAETTVRSQGLVPRQIDESGTTVPMLGVVERNQVSHDDPTVDVVDVRDFVWHESAVSLERAQRVTHRVFHPIGELKRLEALGVYQNTEQLVETKDYAEGYNQREQELFQVNRGKDMVEVLEQWRRTEQGIRVTSIGNRSVLLRDDPNPFWHGQFPFVICTSVPDLFRIPGISEVELIADLQDALWSFLNQRIDNTELLNNAIILIGSDVEDPDQFEWAPGAQWLVDRPDQVSVLQATAIPTEISVGAEEKLKQDLQNIPGASPTLLGQVDPSTQTATEISLTTSLAQRRVALKKQQFRWAGKRVGEQWIALNQQFVDQPRLLERVGADGASAFMQIHPLMLQGDYAIELDAMDESLIRQERRAEAQAKLQVMINAMPVLVATAQAGANPLPNLKQYVDDYLDAFDISDKERYWSNAPPPILPQAQAGSQQQSATSPNGAAQTAPQAYDANAPSNAASMSPLAALQRMGAMAGGPVNAG